MRASCYDAAMRLPITTADAPESEQSWRWQAQNAVTTLEGLERALRLTEDERQGVRYALSQGFPLSVTPYYLKLMDPDDPGCPLRIQSIPQSREATLDPGDLVDPLGEEDHEVAPHLVRAASLRACRGLQRPLRGAALARGR